MSTQQANLQAKTKAQVANIESLMAIVLKESNELAKGTLNWGNVGSLGHIEELLQQAANFSQGIPND